MSGAAAGGPVVAVFGSSEPSPGDRLYEQARELGRLLASRGRTVISGGYGGVMEAASRGARESGGRTIGVTCRIFASRGPNPYLSEIVETSDLHERTRELIDRADDFVILAGKAGTLAELAFLWALDRAGCLGRRRVVLLGADWERILRDLEGHGVLEASQLHRTRIVENPSAVLSALESPETIEDGPS